MNSTLRTLFLAGAVTFCAATVMAGADPAADGSTDPAVLDAPPVGEFGVGVGYGTDTGLAVTAHANAQGLGDKGHQFGFRFELGEDSGAADLSYRYSPVAGRDDLSFGLTLSGITTRPSDAFRFSTDAVKITPRLIYQLSQDTIVSPYLSLSQGRFSDVPPGSSALIAKDSGQRQMTSAGLDFQRVRRDDRDAWQTTLVAQAEVGRSDRGQSFTGLSFDLRHDRQIGAAAKVTAALSAGTILSMSGASHLGDRTILGQSSLRGFDFGGFGPRDIAAEGMPALGGNSYAILRLEARKPGLFGDGARPVPGVFVDAGSLWGLDDTAGGAAGDVVVDDGAHLRAAVGVMLDYRSDFGTFQLSVSKPVRQMEYDRTAPFSFAFSTGF